MVSEPSPHAARERGYHSRGAPALRFGPRAIDIDMLLFDDVVSDDPVCVLPHPRLSRRAFWLVPLLDIAPDIRIGGVRAEKLLTRLKWRLEDDKIFQ